MTSLIYFIQSDAGPIKIGFTADDPRKRMVKIQCDCPWRVKLLGAIAGTVSQEKQIHLLLSRFKTQGEWFEPHPIVLAAINEAMTIGQKFLIRPRDGGPKHTHPICQYRNENGFTLKDVATVAGISHATLSRIERGLYLPSLQMAKRLTQVTGIPLRKIRPDVYEFVLEGAA